LGLGLLTERSFVVNEENVVVDSHLPISARSGVKLSELRVVLKELIVVIVHSHVLLMLVHFYLQLGRAFDRFLLGGRDGRSEPVYLLFERLRERLDYSSLRAVASVNLFLLLSWAGLGGIRS
jgi:hypothetical protein